MEVSTLALVGALKGLGGGGAPTNHQLLNQACANINYFM